MFDVGSTVVTFPSCTRCRSGHLTSVCIIPSRFNLISRFFQRNNRINQELILAAASEGRRECENLFVY